MAKGKGLWLMGKPEGRETDPCLLPRPPRVICWHCHWPRQLTPSPHLGVWGHSVLPGAVLLLDNREPVVQPTPDPTMCKCFPLSGPCCSCP